MQNISSTTRQNIILIGLALAIGFVGWLIYDAVNKAGKTEFTVQAAPADATITINGTPAEPGKRWLRDGVYEIRAEKDGFETKAKTVTVPGDIATIVNLTPVSDEAKKWAKDNFEAYGEAYDPLLDEDALFPKLPLKNFLYTVTASGSESDTEITLRVSSFRGSRNAPIEAIKRYGVNPAEYRYTFNYRNPFNE